MGMFHRKSKWQRVMGMVGSSTVKNPVVKTGVKTGAATLTGIATLIAASAAVSSRRRKND
jgi:LPXTG-motif cell wall-anchored protein